MSTSLKHLLRDIKRGEYDHRGEDLISKVTVEVRKREGILAVDQVMELRKGDLVRVKRGRAAKGRPRFLGGRTGKITSSPRDIMVKIKLDKPCYRRTGIIEVVEVPANFVEKL